MIDIQNIHTYVYIYMSFNLPQTNCSVLSSLILGKLIRVLILRVFAKVILECVEY